MATLRQHITLVKRAVPKYTREEILMMFDEIEEIVVGEQNAQFKYIDPNTGLPPFIVTTDGVYEYDCPSNCRLTTAVFVEDPSDTYSAQSWGRHYESYFYNNREFQKVAVQSFEATEDLPAKVTFTFNPGTTTQTYYNEYFIKHTPLTDESQQLALPPRVGYLMRRAVISELKAEQYDPENVLSMGMVEKVANKIRSILNRVAQPRTYRTPWREEDRDLEGFYDDTF